jgi:hypothetical protein
VVPFTNPNHLRLRAPVSSASWPLPRRARTSNLRIHINLLNDHWTLISGHWSADGIQPTVGHDGVRGNRAREVGS